MKKVGIYSRQQGDQLIFEQNILNDINGAMKQGQIVIYVQPKYDVVHKKIVGGRIVGKMVTSEIWRYHHLNL